MSLPLPRVDTSLVLRADFGDDLAWEALKAAAGRMTGLVAASSRTRLVAHLA